MTASRRKDQIIEALRSRNRLNLGDSGKRVAGFENTRWRITEVGLAENM